MLGLGDIVFPGFMIAMLLRFDISRNKQAPSQRPSFVYFRTGLISYALALLATGVVLHVFQAAQVIPTSFFKRYMFVTFLHFSL